MERTVQARCHHAWVRRAPRVRLQDAIHQSRQSVRQVAADVPLYCLSQRAGSLRGGASSCAHVGRGGATAKLAGEGVRAHLHVRVALVAHPAQQRMQRLGPLWPGCRIVLARDVEQRRGGRTGGGVLQAVPRRQGDCPVRR